MNCYQRDGPEAWGKGVGQQVVLPTVIIISVCIITRALLIRIRNKQFSVRAIKTDWHVPSVSLFRFSVCFGKLGQCWLTTNGKSITRCSSQWLWTTSILTSLINKRLCVILLCSRFAIGSSPQVLSVYKLIRRVSSETFKCDVRTNCSHLFNKYFSLKVRQTCSQSCD